MSSGGVVRIFFIVKRSNCNSLEGILYKKKLTTEKSLAFGGCLKLFLNLNSVGPDQTAPKGAV